MYCTNCGAQVPEEDAFCTQCGSRMTIRAETASASVLPLRQQSVWVMVLLELVTLGIYGPYWYFSRRTSFHALSSSQRLPETLLSIVLVATIVSAVLTIVSFFPSDPSSIEAIYQVIDLVIAAFFLFFAFRVRGILRDHYASQGVGDAGISGFWLFLFNLFCLQYKINRMTLAPIPRGEDATAARLRELKALLDDDLITESEFEAKKADLLREL